MVGMLGLPSACCYYVAHWPGRGTTLAVYFRRAAVRQAFVMTAVSGLILWWLHYRLRLPTILTIEYTSAAAGTAIALYGTCFVQGLGDFTRFNLIRVISAALSAAPMLVIALMMRLTPLRPVWRIWFLPGVALPWAGAGFAGPTDRAITGRSRPMSAARSARMAGGAWPV